MLDYLGIFKELNKKRVNYIVVGGIAINLYGIPRMTYDIDLLLDLEDINLEKFLQLLKKWGFMPKAPVDIMDFAKKELRDNWIKNKNMKAFNLYNKEWAMSEIDIIINSPLDYQKASQKIKKIIIQGVTIPTISIEDLIKMKKNTGRKQDKADVRYLERIKDEKK